MRLLVMLRRRTKAVLMLAAIGLLTAAVLTVRERPVWRAARVAERALEAGQYDLAWSAVGRWLQAHPNAAEAQFLRAKVAIALGRRHDIYDGLKQAEALGYPDDRLAVLRALLDAQQGRLTEAQPVLARAFAEARTPDPMLDEALARVYLGLYDFPHAGTVLARWAKDAPADPRPPLWRARTHLRRDAEPGIVIADYREALRRDPDLAEARLGLADALAQAQRNREAAEEYAAFLAVRPDDPAGQLGAGRNAWELGNEADAVRHLDRALELDPDSAPAHLERAKIDLRRQDLAAALAHLDRAAALAPFDQAIHYQRSLALKRLGRPDEAAKEHAAFTRLSQERRQLDDLQERLADAPRDTQLQAAIAAWMFTHGYEAEGVQWSRKILAITPRHSETCLLLAHYYERRGDLETARAYRARVSASPH